MTATNHALTGAVIGLTIQSPIAIPLAFFSHFILDALPHFGLQKRDTVFKIYLSLDGLLVFSLGVLVILTNTPNLWVVLFSIFAAVIPDIAWAYRWYKEVNCASNPNTFNDPLTEFHSKIQWYEKPTGILFEAIWAMLMIVAITRLL